MEIKDLNKAIIKTTRDTMITKATEEMCQEMGRFSIIESLQLKKLREEEREKEPHNLDKWRREKMKLKK